jgi:hypothetical protein
MNNWCICWFLRIFWLGIFIFNVLSACRLYKSFGVKGLILVGQSLDWVASWASLQQAADVSGTVRRPKVFVIKHCAWRINVCQYDSVPVWQTLCRYDRHFASMKVCQYDRHCASMTALCQYDRQCTNMTDTVPVWQTLCQYDRQCTSMTDTVPVWQTLCRYDRYCASMTDTVPIWQTLCQYDRHCASMTDSVPVCQTLC